MKFYCDKKYTIISTLKIIGLALACILILFALNYITNLLFGYIIVPYILGAPAVFAVTAIYRSMLLITLPEFILSDDKLKYFNTFWYVTLNWDSFDDVIYSREMESLELKIKTNGMVEKINLSSLISDQKEAFLSEVSTKKNINYL